MPALTDHPAPEFVPGESAPTMPPAIPASEADGPMPELTDHPAPEFVPPTAPPAPMTPARDDTLPLPADEEIVPPVAAPGSSAPGSSAPGSSAPGSSEGLTP